MLLVCFTIGIVHSDIDLDGIPDAEDPYPETSLEAPVIFTPYENEIIYSPNREVKLTGTAEVGSRVELYDDGAVSALSCQEADGGTVTGNGLTVAASTGGGSVDSVSLLTAGTVVDQVFYNTHIDSIANDWITNVTASWATEVLDDAIDGICDYQAGSQPEDRCGEAAFPAQVIALATSSRVFLFDAQTRKFWKSMAVAGITSLAALDGKIFVGTDSLVHVFDFAGDNLIGTYPTLPGAVAGLDTVSVGTTQYVAVGTDAGAAVINLETGDVFTSDITGALIGVGITSSNRVLLATATAAYISDEAIDLMAANDWTSQNITAQVRFPQGTPGTITTVSSDLIGLTTGVSRVFDDGFGKVLVQHVTIDSATLPMGLETQGQWLETTPTVAADVSSTGLALNNIGNVPSAEVEINADTTMFNFGGTSGYLESQNNTDFSVAGKHLTVGAWVRRPDFGGNGPFEKVISHGEGNTAGDWDYWLSAGEDFFGYGLGADPYYFGVTTTEDEKAASAFTFAIDKWQLLVGTYDGEAGELRMYLDGVEQDQDIFFPGVNPVSLSGDIATVDKMLRVGYGYDTEYFGGDVAMPFVAAESYSPEQVAILHRYSNGWFTEDTTTTLQGASNVVVDVTCDKVYQECYVLTDDGAVTRIDGNLFAGGVTNPVADLVNATIVTPTHLGTWECTHAFETSGAYAVTAKTYWGNTQTAIQSEERSFTIFSLAEQKLDTPNILAFPTQYVGEGAATVMWTTDELDGDYFVAEIATDVDFLTGVREQVVMGQAAQFVGLDDNQEYFFRVKHVSNSGASSDLSEMVSITVDSAAPVAGEVVNTTGNMTPETGVEFDWEVTPFSDLGSGIMWYEVEVSTDQSFADETQMVMNNDRFEHTSVGVTGETGKTYYARVRAMDAVGLWSEWATAPGTLVDETAPSEIVVTAVEQTAGTAAGLTWTTAVDAESGVDSYDVWQKKGEEAATLIATVSPAARTYKVEGLEDGVAYSFQVVAKNGVGRTTPSNAVLTTVATTYVGAAQIIAPIYTNTGTFDLEWINNNYALADQFVVSRNGVDIATLATTETTYTDTFAFVDGEGYEYVVRADMETPAVDFVSADSEIHRMLADMAAPTEDAVVISATATNGWYNENFSVLQGGSDAGTEFDPAASTGTGFGSGTDGAMVEVDAAYTPHNVPVQITTNGNTNALQFEVSDRAGNQNVLAGMTDLNLDKVAPVVELNQTMMADGAFEDVNGNVSTNSVTYEIVATDVFSGVDTYELSYRLDRNGDGFIKIEDGDLEWTDWATVAAIDALAIAEDGRYALRARVTDLAGNATVTKSLFVNVDQVAPIVSADYPTEVLTEKMTIQLAAADVSGAATGFATMYYTTDGSDPVSSLFPVRREGTLLEVDPAVNALAGIFTVKYFAEDAAGNQSPVMTATNDPAADLDTDGMNDAWETVYGGDLDPAGNEDGDALTNLEEFTQNTSPTQDDTDMDGVNDDLEVAAGTDPLNSADHVFQWMTPNEAATTGGKFTIVGTMTPGAIAEVVDVTNSTVLGLMTADPQGRIAMELELADGAHEIKVQFQHPANPLAIVVSEARNITVDAVSVQPAITNIADGDQIGPNVSRVEVENLTADAEAELFEIVDGVVISLGRVITDGDGKADFWLPRRSDSRRIFAMDITTRATTEVVAFEQGLIIGGMVLDEANAAIEGALVELTDTQGNTLTVLSAANGTYALFSRVNQTSTIRFSKTGFLSHEQAVVTAYDDVPLTVNLLTTDLEVMVTGTVSDPYGAKLVGVAVRLAAGTSTYSAVTNVNGTYSIAGVPASTVYTATFTLADYMTHTQPVNVERQSVVVDVTLVKTADAVLISGQTLELTTDIPLLGTAVKFTSQPDGYKFQTQSYADGNFSFYVLRSMVYGANFTKGGYEAVAQEITTTTTPTVMPAVRLKPEAAAPGAAKKGWSGRVLGDKDDIIADYWVPSMTYEESLAQVDRLNAGIAGQVRTVRKDGKEVFAGYIVGRIGLGQYYRQDDQQVFRLTAYSDRIQQMHAAAQIGHCLDYRDTVMEFSDVQTKSKWYTTVAKMHSLGQMKLTEDRKFRPEEALSWNELLDMTFAVDCRQPDTFDVLRSFKHDAWDNFPLRNTIEARRAYTALDEGWVTTDTDLSEVPTREEVLRLWMNIYAVPVDQAATTTSFTDVSGTIVPTLVAARKFSLIPASSTFRANRPLVRKEAAEWYTMFYDAEQAELINRDAPLNQFDDKKRSISYVASKEAQAEGALLQREIAEKRIDRIMEGAVQLSDEELAGNSGFVIRRGESRDDFRERFAIAKESVEAEKQKLLAKMDYEKMRKESLASRIEEKVVKESMIKVVDRSGFIRRAGESRDDFRERLDIAKAALAEKKLALSVTPVAMRASAPKIVGGPTRATQALGRIKVDLEEDKMCRVKMSWETKTQYRKRCNKQTESELQAKKDAYKKSFDRLTKREGFYEAKQQTVEPEEVTVTAPTKSSSESILKKRRMDVALRRSPEVETETASSGRVKLRR